MNPAIKITNIVALLLLAILAWSGLNNCTTTKGGNRQHLLGG